VSFSVMVPFLASLPPLASAFSPSMRLRYARVTMSRFGHSSFLLSPKVPASLSSSPSAFFFGPLLPLASPSARGSAVCHQRRKACGSSWQASSRNASASRGGGRRPSHFAGAGSFRSARALCGRLVSHDSPARSATTARPNHSVNRTPGKRRFAGLPVPSRLRRSVAGYVERWAP